MKNNNRRFWSIQITPTTETAREIAAYEHAISLLGLEHSERGQSAIGWQRFKKPAQYYEFAFNKLHKKGHAIDTIERVAKVIEEAEGSLVSLHGRMAQLRKAVEEGNANAEFVDVSFQAPSPGPVRLALPRGPYCCEEGEKAGVTICESCNRFVSLKEFI